MGGTQLETMGTTAYVPEIHTRSEAATPSPEQSDALAAAQAGQPLSEAQRQALPQDGEGRISKAAFVFDAGKDAYRCPAGFALPLLRTSTDRSRAGRVTRKQYHCSSCLACAHAGMCCRDPAKGRLVNRDQYEEHRERMRARLTSEEGRRQYRRRRETVEPRFGHIKRNLGIRRFMHRGSRPDRPAPNDRVFVAPRPALKIFKPSDPRSISTVSDGRGSDRRVVCTATEPSIAPDAVCVTSHRRRVIPTGRAQY